jgi:AmmeMemoRadiSam system protein A
MFSLSNNSKEWLLHQARRAIEHYLETKKLIDEDKVIDGVDETVLTETSQKSGVYIIIRKKVKQSRELAIRGMMGTVTATEELWKVIPKFAVNAAFYDPRVPRLRPYELNEIDIGISLISEPKEFKMEEGRFLDFLERKHPGVVMEFLGRETHFLPLVWNEFPEAQQLLRVLAMQLGFKADVINDKRVKYKIFNVEEFTEEILNSKF